MPCYFKLAAQHPYTHHPRHTHPLSILLHTYTAITHLDLVNTYIKNIKPCKIPTRRQLVTSIQQWTLRWGKETYSKNFHKEYFDILGNCIIMCNSCTTLRLATMPTDKSKLLTSQVSKAVKN